MLKLTINRVRIDLRIEPVTPLLIKTGDKGAALLHPERPDLMFVRTGPRDAETVYLPGSSIKGVVRSAAERILRTVGADACDPLDHQGRCQREASNKGDEIARRGSHEEHPQAAVYAMLCTACRTFGSQALAGRVSFSDAYPPEAERARANATERRSGVSIDRKTGGPARGKLFDMELVTRGAFDTSIHLANVELWQLALLGIVLHDIETGFVRFGSAKSRGLGHVRIAPRGAIFEQVDPAHATTVPSGVGALRDLAKYQLFAGRGDALADAAGGDGKQTAIGQTWVWTDREAVWRLLDACAGRPWAEFCAAAPSRRP